MELDTNPECTSQWRPPQSQQERSVAHIKLSVLLFLVAG